MTDIKNKFITTGSKIAYQNKWMHVREDTIIRPNGDPGLYGVVVTPPSVFVVALTEAEEVVMVGQFRYPTQMYSLEIPAGGTEGKDVLESAKRELLEESGYEAKKWDKVGTFQMMNGIASEIATTYLARDLHRATDILDQDDGISEMKVISLSKILEMIKSGEITDGATIVAITQVMLHLGKM